MKRALTLCLLLFGMIAQAANGNNEDFLAKKKAIYTEVRELLDSGKITVKEAQFIWQKKVKHLRKEEAK